jgi:Tol biopolymer transport system component
MTGRKVALWWIVMLLAALGCGKSSSPTKPDNRTCAHPDTMRILGFVPAGAPIGSTVRIIGEQYGARDTTCKVVLSGIEAQIASWSDNEIEFIVPEGVGEDTLIGITVTAKCRIAAGADFDVTPAGITRLTDDVASDGEPCWSADGAWIYFTSNRSGNDDLWRVPAAGGAAVQVTNDPAPDNWPDANPSGTSLVWGSESFHNGTNPDRDYEIFYGYPPGGRVSQLTFNEILNRTPCWSPTNYGGYSIAYCAYFDEYPSTGVPKIMLYSNAAGHSILADGENPNFSPNGREIVYQNNSDLYAIRVTGGSPVQLTNEQHDSWPHWGWANDKIVFERSGGSGASDIWVMDSDGGNSHALIATGGDDHSPTWSPNCKKVVFASFRWNNLDIYVYEMP